MSATADQPALAQMRDLGAIVTRANSVMFERFNDFGTEDGAKVAKINLEEILSKLN